MAKIFIGMPVFNAERFLEAAVESIVGQEYRCWQLLISDNHSSDRTPEIARHYASLDSRIRFVRQDRNLGPLANFKFLLNAAEGDYFMWAAGDDIFSPGYIESGVAALEADPDVGLAFGNVVNIDTYGHVIRRYPGFAGFSGPKQWRNIFNFLMSPEIMGKANLIYGLMRLGVVRRADEEAPLNEHWGSDMTFVLAVIGRSRFAYRDSMLLNKRIERDGDQADNPSPIVIGNPKNHCFELADARQYITDQQKAMRQTPYWFLTVVTTWWRLVAVSVRKGAMKVAVNLLRVMRTFSGNEK